MFTSRIVGHSPAVQELRQEAARAARTEMPVLIQGETGVGKELVARDIHLRSDRAAGPLITVDCAAIVESLFEAEMFGIESGVATGVRERTGKVAKAHHGTLFLDEVAELPPRGQAKLLRVLEESAVVRVGSSRAERVDMRVLAATNRDLRSLVAQGAFREDLFYRLCGLEIRVPPLRVRKGDVVTLASHFAAVIEGKSVTITRSAAVALEAYRWPGNVRELRRTVECALSWEPTQHIEARHLPVHVRGQYEDVIAASLTRGDTLREWATAYVALTVDRCQSKREACRVLGISYHTLCAYTARYGSIKSAGPSCADPEPV